MMPLIGESGAGQSEAWAVVELGGARLGDPRRTERLVTLTAAFAKHPNASIPGACESWSATKGAYRFFSNNAVDPEDITEAHRQSTLKRIADHDMILAVQDTTAYNFTTHRAIRGLGPVGNSQVDSAGFLVHTCLALSLEGVPLGLLGQNLWVRPEPDGGAKRNQRKRLPVEEKESGRWLAMLETSTKGLPPTTRVLTIADREADIVDFFLAAIRNQQDVLVRGAWNRKLNDQDGYLWDAVEQAEVIGHVSVQVPRGDDRPLRVADLELRAAKVTLRPPLHRKASLPPITLNAVLVRELNPPKDQEAIEWLLLITLNVSSEADAVACVRWYTQRWKIERYHYTLKSGCRIEELQFEDLERFHRALAVYSVVAWRLLYLTYMARKEPDQPCTAALSASEWKALYCAIHRTKQVPYTPPNLQTAILWIARLGGFLARKRDGSPGVKVLWQGFRRLEDLTTMWEILNPSN